jgi:hypothetical protein
VLVGGLCVYTKHPTQLAINKGIGNSSHKSEISF